MRGNNRVDARQKWFVLFKPIGDNQPVHFFFFFCFDFFGTVFQSILS